MPAEGIAYLPEKKLLTWEEMLRIVQILHPMGIKKVRITGGEPFVRNGLMDFLTDLSRLKDLEICLTTNGVLLESNIQKLADLGIKSINLSLDALDRDRFFQITRRNDYDIVYQNLLRLIEADFQVKINAVVMQGKNEQDILALTNFAKTHPVSVRFIEEMPFNGSGQLEPILHWNHRRILSEIQEAYPSIQVLPGKYGETSTNYQIPGFLGDVGIIAAFTRNFCGTCNRVRVTALGQVKTCLYDDGVFDLKEYMRSGVNDVEIADTFLRLFAQRSLNGFDAEKNRKGVIQESMTTIGG
jgi:cyclic pyranopterin phosphate synthase